MIINDAEHWKNLFPPLCPNVYEIELYKHHSKGYGPICLLGMTKELQNLCDFMVDLYPTNQQKPVIKENWNNLKEYAEVVIGDGVLNLEGLQLVDKLINRYEKLIFRVFLKKFPWMKYATHFPQEFPGASLVIPTQEHIAMVIWDNTFAS
jgi:hypothetical protein